MLAFSFLLLAILSLLGLVACVFHRRLSGWLWIVALGFAGLAACSVGAPFMTAASQTSALMGLIMTDESALSVFLGAFCYSFVLVVLGFAGLLTSIRDKFLRLQRKLTLGDIARRAGLPGGADLRPFQQGQEDRYDIQR